MALKATIHKAQIQLTDMDRHYYDALNLVIAQHPSETDERMMVRILAFILNAHEQLQFTKGLSSDDEPDIWQVDLTGEIDVWIDLGIPDEKRIRKACARSKAVKIYSYGGGSAQMWWQKVQNKVSRFNHLQVINLPQEQVIEMGQMVKRAMELQCTVDNGEVWLTDGEMSVTILPETWYPQ